MTTGGNNSRAQVDVADDDQLAVLGKSNDASYKSRSVDRSVAAGAQWRERVMYAKFVLLCAFAVVLPVLESPKNMILFLLLLFLIGEWALRIWRSGPAFDKIEIALIAIVLSSVLSTAANWPLENGLKGVKDVLGQLALFGVLYRANLSERRQIRLLQFVALGVVVGLAWGVAEAVDGRSMHLQFHSAGAVTQSALYLAIALTMTFALLVAGTLRNESAKTMAGWGLASGVMLIGLFLMGSRGPILAAGVAVVFMLISAKHWKLWLGATLIAIPAIALVLLLPNWFGQDRAVKKAEQMIAGVIPSADEDRIVNWRIALAQLKYGESHVLGVGPRNYHTIDYRKFSFDPPLSYEPKKLNHAHNLILTKLVEEGILGLVTMLAFFGIVVVHLRKRWQSRGWEALVGMGALLVPLLVSMFNTPWYQESALLAMMLIAIAIAPSRGHTVRSAAF